MMRRLMRGAAAATLIAGLAPPALAAAQPDYYGDPQPRYGANPSQYNDPREYRDDHDYDQGDGRYDQDQGDERPDADDDARRYGDNQGDRADDGDRSDDGDRDYGRQDDDRYGGQYEEHSYDTQRSYAQSYGSGSQTWRDAWGRTCRWRDQTGRDEEGYVTHRWVQYCR